MVSAIGGYSWEAPRGASGAFFGEPVGSVLGAGPPMAGASLRDLLSEPPPVRSSGPTGTSALAALVAGTTGSSRSSERGGGGFLADLIRGREARMGDQTPLDELGLGRGSSLFSPRFNDAPPKLPSWLGDPLRDQAEHRRSYEDAQANMSSLLPGFPRPGHLEAEVSSRLSGMARVSSREREAEVNSLMSGMGRGSHREADVSSLLSGMGLHREVSPFDTHQSSRSRLAGTTPAGAAPGGGGTGGGGVAGGTLHEQGLARFVEIQLRKAFNRCDSSGDGLVNRRELIRLIRQDSEVAELLGLPQHIHNDDSFDIFERTFEDIDANSDHQISWEEFRDFCFKGLGRSSPLAALEASIVRSAAASAAASAAPSVLPSAAASAAARVAVQTAVHSVGAASAVTSVAPSVHEPLPASRQASSVLASAAPGDSVAALLEEARLARLAAEALAAEEPQSAYSETMPSELPCSEPVRSEAAHSEVAGSEAARSQLARSEAARSGLARSEQARSEAARSEGVRSQVRSELARSDMARSELAQSEAAPSEPGSAPGAGHVETVRRAAAEPTPVSSEVNAPTRPLFAKAALWAPPADYRSNSPVAVVGGRAGSPSRLLIRTSSPLRGTGLAALEGTPFAVLEAARRSGTPGVPLVVGGHSGSPGPAGRSIARQRPISRQEMLSTGRLVPCGDVHDDEAQEQPPTPPPGAHVPLTQVLAPREVGHVLQPQVAVPPSHSALCGCCGDPCGPPPALPGILPGMFPGGLPLGMVALGGAPPGGLPGGMLPGGLATGALPLGGLPPGGLRLGGLPPGGPGALLPGTGLLPGLLPPGMLPLAGAMLPGPLPPGMLPSGMPTGPLPPGWLPGGRLPMQPLPMHPGPLLPTGPLGPPGSGFGLLPGYVAPPPPQPKQFLAGFRNLVRQSEEILAKLEAQEQGQGQFRDLVDESTQVLAEIEEREKRLQLQPPPKAVPWGPHPGFPLGPMLPGSFGASTGSGPRTLPPGAVPCGSPAPPQSKLLTRQAGEPQLGAKSAKPPEGAGDAGAPPTTTYGPDGQPVDPAASIAAPEAPSAAATFDGIDRNHDGIITREEWSQAVASQQQQQELIQQQQQQLEQLRDQLHQHQEQLPQKLELLHQHLEEQQKLLQSPELLLRSRQLQPPELPQQVQTPQPDDPSQFAYAPQVDVYDPDTLYI